MDAKYICDALRDKLNDCQCAAYGRCECGCGAVWPEDVASGAADIIESQAARIAELEAVVELFRTQFEKTTGDLVLRDIAMGKVYEAAARRLRSLPDPAMQTEPEYGWSDLAEEILGHSWSDIQQEQQDLLRGTCVRLMREVGWVMCGVYATSATHWQWYLCDVNGYVPRKVHTNIYGEARCYRDMLKHAGVLK